MGRVSRKFKKRSSLSVLTESEYECIEEAMREQESKKAYAVTIVVAMHIINNFYGQLKSRKTRHNIFLKLYAEYAEKYKTEPEIFDPYRELVKKAGIKI